MRAPLYVPTHALLMEIGEAHAEGEIPFRISYEQWIRDLSRSGQYIPTES